MRKVLGVKRLREILPEEFIDMLYEIYTVKEVDQILISYLKGKRSTVRINTLLSNEYKIINEFNENGIKYNKFNALAGCFLLKNNDENTVRRLSCYKKGEIYFQNISSIIPSTLLNLKEHNKILDMCASPGGKTLKIAEIINNNGEIIANEVNKIRYERLKYNMEKHGAKCVKCLNEDGRLLFKQYDSIFDNILIDAPCSGEGILKITENKKIKLINNNNFVKVQKQLLESAYKCLKKGGEIIYSTCTISPKENEEVINYIINKYKDLKVAQISLSMTNAKPALVKYKDKNYNNTLKKAIRILPNEVIEGFFICKLKKEI